MSGQVSRLCVFAASPGDTEEERACLDAVVGELNRGIAAEKGLVVELVRWETHVRPGIGSDAQAVINAQIGKPDIVVAMFWRRLGTPTPRAPSGTAEEIEAAIERWRSDDDVELLVYFNQRPFTPSSADLDQLSRLHAFRRELQGRGVLVWEYDGAAEFERQVRQHLASAIRAYPSATATAASVPPAAAPSHPAVETDIAFTARVDARDALETHAVVADLRAGLRQQGFGRSAADRAATVLLELLANVRNHAPSPEATVEAGVRTGSLPGVGLVVWQRRASFDVHAAVRAGWDAYERGSREHGLVKVARLASGLRAVEDGPLMAVCCTVFDLPSIGSGVFDEFSFVRPASIEFDVPRRCFLDGELYDANQLRDACSYALSAPAPRVIALCFEGMSVGEHELLAIELAGNVLPSETYVPPPPQPLPAALGVTPRSEDALEAGFEARFHDAFVEGRVVFHAFETGFVPTSMAQDWAARWDAPCFTDPDELRAFLRTQALSPRHG